MKRVNNLKKKKKVAIYVASAVTRVILGVIFVLNILSFFSASVPSVFFFSLCFEFAIRLIPKKAFYTIHVSFHVEYLIIHTYFLSAVHWSIQVQAVFSMYTFERCSKTVIISKEVSHHAQMVYTQEFWRSLKYDSSKFLTKPTVCFKMGWLSIW